MTNINSSPADAADFEVRQLGCITNIEIWTIKLFIFDISHSISISKEKIERVILLYWIKIFMLDPIVQYHNQTTDVGQIKPKYR